MNDTNWLHRILEKMWWFIRAFIHPFITVLFAIYNYHYLVDGIKATWLKYLILIISVAYIIMTLCIAIYKVTGNINNPPPPPPKTW